ncbi:MAG: DUF2312 domain-containing protein [Alphaproteobacteria bacterium]|nr:DUF2312 domain-containing protein [Alphaproteobacteria bacterium]
MTIDNTAGQRLRGFVERHERLQEEIDALKADQKEVLGEAKGTGFDVGTIRDILRLRKLERRHGRAAVLEREELLDLYKAALGMLYDTPLGEAARRRLSRQGGAEDFTEAIAEAADLFSDTEQEAPPAEPPPPEVSLEDARRMGAEAAAAGRPVTTNPFPAHDPYRAAWDEAWCGAAGSDGMDIPEAWRRRKPKSKTPPPEPPTKDDDADDQEAA